MLSELANFCVRNKSMRTRERKVHGVRLIHDNLGIFLFDSGLFDTLERGLGLFVGLLRLLTLEGGLLTLEGGLLLLEFGLLTLEDGLLSCLLLLEFGLLTLEDGLLTFEGGHQRIIALFSCVHNFLGKLPDFFFQGLGLFKWSHFVACAGSLGHTGGAAPRKKLQRAATLQKKAWVARGDCEERRGDRESARAVTAARRRRRRAETAAGATMGQEPVPEAGARSHSTVLCWPTHGSRVQPRDC